MAANTEQAPHLVVDSERPTPERVQEIRVIGHAPLFYWWPVWAFGYALAMYIALDPSKGKAFLGGQEVWFPSNQSLGVAYCIVIALIVVMTNVALRGLSSGILILVMLFVTLLFAYLNVWDTLLHWLGELTAFMSMGFYLLFSTIILVAWALAFFLFDRTDYWVFRPGQAINVSVFGGGEHTYDTTGMSVYKLRNDLFRHWILGIGSGDLHIAATGAMRSEVVINNVLFINKKIDRVMELVSMKPDQRAELITAGKPN